MSRSSRWAAAHGTDRFFFQPSACGDECRDANPQTSSGGDDEGSDVCDECAKSWMESQNLDMVGPSGAVGSDIDCREASPSESGVGSRGSGTDVGVVDIAGFEVQDEVRSIDLHICVPWFNVLGHVSA